MQSPYPLEGRVETRVGACHDLMSKCNDKVNSVGINRIKTKFGMLLVLLATLMPGSFAFADGSGAMSPFPITGAFSAHSRADREHVSIIEFGGNYDRDLAAGVNNVEPRAVIAREFYRTHPDNYDFLVVFSSFEFNTGDAVAFHWAVQNKVQGIGLPQFDNSGLFGSKGKLLGFIDMAVLTRYQTDPVNPAFEWPLGVLAHEMLHQWGSFVKFKQANGSISTDLLGRQDAHWSYLLDSSASVEYGSKWRDNGNGTYTSVGTRTFFSPLDLYLMGFYKASEVPNFTLIDNPQIDKTQTPQENVTVTGTPRTISINDIIAAEGPRVPDASTSQKEFRLGFIFLVGPNQEVTDAQILAINNIRNAYMTRFAILTGGRALAQSYPEAMPVGSTGTPGTVSGGDVRTTPANLEEGLAWLRAHQNAQGFWSDKDTTSQRDTVVAMSTLRQLDSSFTGGTAALSWLAQHPSSNNDYLARQASLLAEVGQSGADHRNALLATQNADGGWGIGAGYHSNVLDTSLAVLALAGQGVNQAVLDKAGQYLVTAQNSDGGWSNAQGSPSRTSVTATALRALKTLNLQAAVTSKAITFLIGKQNPDGGFGDSPSTVHDTANVLQAAIAVDVVDRIHPDAAAAYLLALQGTDGSWEGSVYSTAVAVAAIKRFNFPNWAVTSISATPVTVSDGDKIKLDIAIKNDANLVTPAGVLRVYDGDPASGGKPIGPDISVPVMGPGVTLSFSPYFDTLDKPGAHTLVAVVDPDKLQAEMSEADNRASVGVTVQTAPAGIDLALANPDITVIPVQPNHLPSTLGLSATVRNVGLTDAFAVHVVLLAGPVGNQVVVADTVVDVLNRSNVVVNFNYLLTTPGTVNFTVQVDPANSIAETNKANNTATAAVTTSPNVDLAVSNADISVDKNPALVGDDIKFNVVLHNSGTVDAPASEVRYTITDGNTTKTLRTNTVQIAAGQKVEQQIVWRVDMTGTLRFSVQMDPSALVPETDRTNNTASLTLSSGTVSGPNLVVTYQDFTFSPVLALEAGNVVLSAVVRNTGMVVANNIPVVFYSGEPGNGGTVLGTANIATLAPNADATVTTTWTEVPTPGDKLLFVVIDPDNTITEFSKTDNSAFNVLTVLSLPDLAISSGDVKFTPASPRAGETLTITAQVANLGDQSAANVVVRAFDGDPASGGTQIGADQTIPGIAGHGSAAVNFSLNIAAVSAARPIVVQVDPANLILERNKANNTAQHDLAVQDGNFYVSNLFISPNGDGIKDTTEFFFRLSSAATVSVDVVNKRDVVVRHFSGDALANVSTGSVVWDGLDDAGRLVQDGPYKLRIVATGGAVAGEVKVSLDTNRSSLLDAVNTRYSAFSNLTCELPEVDLKFTEDDEKAFFGIQNGSSPQVAYPRGIYSMDGNGGDVRAIVPESFFPLVSYTYYDYYTRKYVTGYVESTSRLDAAAANGSKVTFSRSNYRDTSLNSRWLVDGDGKNPQQALAIPYSQNNMSQLSNDGKMMYVLDDSGLLLGISTEPGAVAQTIRSPSGTFDWWGNSTYSPDLRKVALSGWGSSYDVVDMKSGQSFNIPNVPGYYEPSFSWSPDSKYIVTGIDTVWNPDKNNIDIYDMNGTIVKAIPSPIQSTGDRIAVVTGKPVWNSNSTEFAISVAISDRSYSCDPPPPGTDLGGIYTVDVASGVTHKVASFIDYIQGECGASYHISTWDGAQWVERDVLHYGLFMQQQSAKLSKYLPDAEGKYRVRIRQAGHETAHVDDVALSIDHQRVAPSTAVHLGTNADALAKVIAPDNEVLFLHEATLEVQWKTPPAGGQIDLVLGAREESISKRKDLLPFSYPASAGQVYNYVIAGQRPMIVDGNQTGQDNLGTPLFKVYSRPGTGHPAANVYGYVQSDDQYLYAALDFTVDNDEDGANDWATIRIRRAGVWKDYRVTKADKTNGQVGFIHTGKVNFGHKYYEFKIALADIDAHAGDILDIAFQGYGSAAINTTPQSTDLSVGNNSTLYWVPGERSLIYYNYVGNYGPQYLAIKLDEQNSRAVLFADWMDNYENQVQNLSFSPAGRQMLFTSGRDTNDPASRCYQQGVDTWSFHSLLNLTADLRAIRASTGGVRLEGSAADQNFAGYSLDYANADTPDQWHPVLPAANIPVIDDIFTTWVPPAAGTYFVRLTVRDLAGNTRQNIKRVSWSDTPSITDLYRSPGIISPNGDGVQDEATIHYRVLEPVHLEFNFYNKANGDRVRTIVRDHTAIGAEANVIWDGRDDNGLPVVDGVYRMTVQNYEYFITVDTDVPLTNLALASAYQPRYNTNPATGENVPPAYVDVAPSLRWSVTEDNYLSSVVETGSGIDPLFWNELYNPDPEETGKGDEQLLPLTLDQFVNKTFRLSAKDTAGNNGIVTVTSAPGTTAAGAGKEELIVKSLGDFAINPMLLKNYEKLLSTGKKPNASEFNALVMQSGGLYTRLSGVLYVPMQQQDGGTDLSAILQMNQARFEVFETINSPLAQINVQFRKPTNLLWTEKPVAGYAVTDVSEPALLTAPAIPDQAMNAIWDLAGMDAGETYVVRLRAIDAAGNDHYSNSFLVATGDGFTFHGLILDHTSEDWVKYIAPLLNTPLTEGEYVLWGSENVSQPISEIKLFVHSDQDPRFATERVAATAVKPDGTFIFRTNELQVCTNYTGYIVVLGEPDATGVKQELGRSDSLPFTVPCLKLKTDVQVQYSAVCNGPSPNQVKVRFAPSSLASEAPLKLLTLSRQVPLVGKDIVFNVNKPKSVTIPKEESAIYYPYEFLLDTSALPEGSLQFQAELTNVNDEMVTQAVTVIVDHTPPVIAITYPLEAQGVCGVPVEGVDGTTRNVVTIEGSMEDANGLHYEMDSSTTGESTLSLFHKSRSNNSVYYDSIQAANGVLPPSLLLADKPPFHLPGSVFGPLAAVFDKTGTITARLRAFDNGGYQQCVIRSFQFDGSVAGAAESLDRALFSPNGDGVADSVSITYAVDESARVDIDVFQATGPDVNGQMHISGNRLVSLAEQESTLAGTSSTEWDGREASGGVVQDGKYGVQVTFTDSCGNVTKLVRYVEVDSTLPTISVNYPASTSVLPLIVEIQGAISDLHLQSYTIDYGVGVAPDAWVRLKSGTSNVSNAVLAPWNTYGLQGDYTLRLIGIDAAGNQRTVLIPLNFQTPLNIISAFETIPTPFSPNGDGRRESTAIRVSLDQDAVITLAVKDAQGVIRRTLVSAQVLNKGAASFSWDGKDDAGQVVADGPYTIGLLATSSADSFVKQDEKITVVVDGTAPLVDIKRPTGGFVTATGGVVGSIIDPNLTSYTVSITDSPKAPSWNQIDTGTLVRNNAVLGSLAGMAEGDYAIRIEAQDEAENKVDRVIPFTIDNTPPKVDLSAPADGSFVGIKKLPVNIIGLIVEKNFKSYTLEFAAGATPTDWTTLATGSSLPLPAILKAWDVSALPDGLYTLRLTAEDKAGLTGEKRILITVDNTAPVVSTTSPVEGSYVRLPQDVTGSINEINLATYRIELAPGAKGTSANWSELGAGTAAVANGKLFSWQALPPDGLYTLRLTAKDKADNYAETLLQLNVDTHPPLKPAGLKAEIKNRQDVYLSWTANSESDLAGYAVYRDGNRITPTPVMSPAYVDYNVAEGLHSYYVIAMDKAGWESEHSDLVTAVVDITPPTTRIQSPASLATVSGLVDIKGTAYSANDFKEYRLFVAQSTAPENRLLLRRSPVPITADILFQWNTLGLVEGATYIITLESEDLSGNIGMEQVSVVIDNLPPLAPSGLTATPTGANVQLNWSSNTETDLLGYLVYRNSRLANVTGTLVGDLRPYAVPGAQYPDNNLADGPYTYTVYAIDKAGNMSLPSNVAKVSIDTRAPHTTLSQPASGAKFDTPQYVLAVSADTDIASVQFQYRASTSPNWINLGVPVATLPYSTTFDPVKLGLVSGSYQIQSIATDNTGKVDPAPTPVGVNYVDVTRPAMALGLTSLVTGGDVALKWTANTETDLAGYYIDRSSNTGTVVRITPNPITATSYVDANLADGNYVYTITAVDLADNFADPSNTTALVYTPFLSQPYTPTQNAYIATLQGSGVANATVNASVTTTAGTASLPSLNSDANGKFTWDGLPLLEGDNVIAINLKDAAGNTSKTAEKTVTLGNAPSKPTAVNASAAGYDVTVNWAANPETNIIGYRVFRNDQPLLPLTQITGVTATASSSAYEYYYGASKAIDGDPNTYWYPASLEGEWLAVSWTGNKLVSRVSVSWYGGANAVDFDIEAWSGKGWIKVAEVRNNQDAVSNVDLAQTYLTTQLRVVVHNALRQDGSPVAYVLMNEIAVSYAPTQAATTISDIAPDGNQPYTVTAVNSLGFESLPSASSMVPVGDVTAPDAVTLSGSVSGSDVNLTWTASASTDVARYVLYRDGTLIGTITDLANLSYVDMARPNGTYHYTVTAIDAVNNESVASNDVGVTVAIALPPTPVNLVVTTVPAGGALDLQWAAGGGMNPAAYRVLRSTVSGGPYLPLGDTVTTKKRDSGLTNGVSYFYVVAALDALGNSSVLSNEASGIPLDQYPPVVTLYYPTLAGKIYRSLVGSTSIAARTEPGAMVKLYQNGNLSGQAQARITDNVIPIDNYGYVSPNGRFALVDANNYQDIVLHDIEGQTDTVVVSNISDNHNYFWSDDSSQVIYSGWDADSGTFYIRAYRLSDHTTRVLVPEGIINNINNAHLSPDQTQLAIVADNQGTYGLWRVDLATGNWTAIPTTDPNSIGDFRWSPDGTRLALLYYSQAQQVGVIHLATGIETIVESTAGYSTPEWSPDGSALLYSSLRDGSQQIWKWTLADGLGLALTQGPNSHGSQSWSPDGQTIAYTEIQPGANTSTSVLLDLTAGTTRELTEYHDASWLSSGYLIAYDNSGEYRLEPAGRVEFKQLALSPGDNIFSASVIDQAGNVGVPSASIDVNYGMNDRADLVVTDNDITILPAVPLANEATRISVLVKNQGDIASLPTVASLVMVDPTGSMTTLLDGVALAAINPDGSQMLVADWTAPALAGDYKLVAIVDPQDQVLEISESNNLAIRTVHIAGTAKPEVRVVTDRQAYLPAENVLVTAEAVNNGDTFNGRLEVAIEDMAGYLVQKLLSQNVIDLPYAQKVNVAGSWNTGITFAGNYQVHVTLFDAANLPVVDARTPFTLGVANTLSSSITTDRAVYIGNSNVHAAAVFNYSGNAVLTGAQRVLRIQNANAVTLLQEQLVLGDMLPGSSGSAFLDWNTGNVAPGSYQAIIEISKDGVLLSTARTAFTIQASSNLLSGKLSLLEQAPAVGIEQTASFTVGNSGNTDLSQVPVHVSLVDPDLQSTLQTQLSLQDIDVGAQATGSVKFATDGLQLKTYTVVLSADVPDSNGSPVTLTLATASFPLVDRTPPGVVLRQPVVNGFIRGDAADIVFAKDDLSLVKTVEASIDGSGWLLVPVSNAPQNLYGSALNGLSEGIHTIAARATDAWGNTGSTGVNSFTVDNTPPQILISGAADSNYYSADVIPGVVVSDANLDKTTILLNGNSYISGTPIQTDGIHTLTVLANDKAGNTAQQVIRFVVDKTIPAVVVTGIQNNGFYNTDVIPVVDVTDTNLVSSTITLNGQAFVSGTIVSAEGVYQLSVAAKDLAGNANTTIMQFTIDKTLPVILISGVVDAKHYNVDVIPSVTASDTNLDKTTATLNGNAYVLGTPIQADGIYTFAVLASDKAGNTAQQAIQFVVDKKTPVVLITGVQNNGLYNIDVAPVIDVTDTGLASSLVTLNGQPFVSGTTVSAEGTYQLSVTANDLAGNVNSIVVQFTIDKTPPALSIASPVDGSKVTVNAINVQGSTEAGANVTLNAGTYQVTLAADTQGQFTFVQIPLVAGVNTINVSARDLVGNSSPPVAVSVTLQVATAGIHGEIKHNGHVLVWLPSKHEQECESHTDNDDFNKVASGYRSAGNFENSGKSHRGANAEDPYAELIALIDSTLRSDGADFRVVRNKDDFVTALRSRRYTTLLFGELHTASNAKSLELDDDIAKEVQATVASGVGLAWIKTHPYEIGNDGGSGCGSDHDEGNCGSNNDDGRDCKSNNHEERNRKSDNHDEGNCDSGNDDGRVGKSNGHDEGSGQSNNHDEGNKAYWDKFFGAKITGVLPNITQLELTNSASSQAGKWVIQPGFGLKVRGMGGILVGSLIPGNKPALVLNRYGNGNVALVTFDPSAIADPQGAISTLHNVLQFAVPVTTTLLPSALAEIRWDASKLGSPLDVRFEEYLPTGMSFLELNGGQIVSGQEAVWEQHLDIDHATFEALVRLPGSVGTFEASAALLQKQGGNLSPLVSDKLTISVTADRSKLGVQVTDTLNKLVVSNKEKVILASAIVSVQNALNRHQVMPDEIRLSIDDLSHAEVLIASLAGDHTDLLSKVGLLMTTYQLAWVEAMKAMNTSLTARQVLNQFNLVVLGNATSSSHVDGRSFIGGNLQGGTYVQHPSDTPASAYAGLTVQGNAGNVMVNNLGVVTGGGLSNSTVNSGPGAVFGNGNRDNFNGPAYVKGTSSGSNFNGGRDASLATGSAVKASTSTNFGFVLTSLSRQLSHLTSTGSTVDLSGNKATFNAVANESGVAIFDLTRIDTAVFKAGEFKFNLNGATTLILNSDEKSATIAANFLGGSARAIGAKTLWNFYEATNLKIDNEWGGSILAPFAHFKNGNNIEGDVLVDSLDQRGEIHLQSFYGQLPMVDSSSCKW